MPRVVFRCDASAAIGSGHVARCMALARALRACGARVELVSRDLPQRVRELLVAGAVDAVHDLAAPGAACGAAPDPGVALGHAHWLSVPQSVDAKQTAPFLEAGDRADWLIVDHYALDARWEQALRPHIANVLAIDDLADRDHACDALLDQNFFLDGADRYRAHVPHDAELMLGPGYALLREEFARERAALPARSGALTRLFVCFGGFDAAGQTLRALEGIEGADLTLEVDIVIGSNDPQRAEVEARCARHSGWRVHFDAANVAALMAPADLAIGASGIMNWERAALGLPAIVASVAENQHVVARDLARDRACIYLGLAADWDADTLGGLLRGLAGTPALMLALGARAHALTDGRGAARVAATLLPPTLTLRRASAADCDSMHRWRDAEETRRHALDTRAIPLAEHRRWFDRVLADKNVVLLIGESAGGPAGVLRYDLHGERASVSVYLVPGLSGRGYGTALLKAGTRWMREHHHEIKAMDATIMHGNERSQRAFERAGYALATHHYVCEPGGD